MISDWRRGMNAIFTGLSAGLRIVWISKGVNRTTDKLDG